MKEVTYLFREFRITKAKNMKKKFLTNLKIFNRDLLKNNLDGNKISTIPMDEKSIDIIWKQLNFRIDFLYSNRASRENISRFLIQKSRENR